MHKKAIAVWEKFQIFPKPLLKTGKSISRSVNAFPAFQCNHSDNRQGG